NISEPSIFADNSVYDHDDLYENESANFTGDKSLWKTLNQTDAFQQTQRCFALADEAAKVIDKAILDFGGFRHFNDPLNTFVKAVEDDSFKLLPQILIPVNTFSISGGPMEKGLTCEEPIPHRNDVNE